MKIFKSKHKLKKEIFNIRNISFVPTMGGLHRGHVSIIKKSKTLKGKILVSIFVNRKQFNKKKDFINYPRNLKRDLNKLKLLHVDYVYIPTFKDIFSFKTKNRIFLDQSSKKLCGKSRKGHFEGVVNVVNRFLEIIKSRYILLGIKDFQQCFLINKHILKKKINTKVIYCKTIRETNGVASSTRNYLLNKKQFQIASNVYKYFYFKKKLIKKNIFYFKNIQIKKDLINLGVTNVDYIELYNIKTFKKPTSRKEKFKIFIAYYLNKVRLIDNI